MRYHKLILPLLILMIGTSTLGARAQDPLSTAMPVFRQFSDGFIGRYKADNHEQVLRLGDGWVKMSFEPMESSRQDTVIATGSAAVPYVGIVQFVVLRHFTSPHRTKQDAEKDKDLFNGDSWTHRYTFTYQNGTWVAGTNQCEQDGKFVIEDRESGRNPEAKFGFHDCVQGEGQ